MAFGVISVWRPFGRKGKGRFWNYLGPKVLQQVLQNSMPRKDGSLYFPMRKPMQIHYTVVKTMLRKVIARSRTIIKNGAPNPSKMEVGKKGGRFENRWWIRPEDATPWRELGDGKQWKPALTTAAQRAAGIM